MTKEFIPYEPALALKELGFDEPCLGYWNIDPYLPKPTFNLVKPFEHEWCVPAPLYQQAFRWFREKYNFCYFIRGNNYDGYSYNIDNLGILQYKFEIDYRFTFKTYEEAEFACLIKLIEIVKNK